MTRHLELACTVCTEEFRVPGHIYAAWGDAVGCPCCGSTDLVLLGVVDPAVVRQAADGGEQMALRPAS
jgi:hypothetical protein